MTKIIEDVLGFIESKKEKIIPEYERVGKPVYSLRNYADLVDLEAESLLNGGTANVLEKIPTLGREGNLLRTPRTSYAVNIDIAFDNRVKVIKDEEDSTKNRYIFVVDQRALMQQNTGELYSKHIVGFVVVKGAKGKPEVLETVHVEEQDFLNNYDTIFDPKEMITIMEVINKYRVEHGTAKMIAKL